VFDAEGRTISDTLQDWLRDPENPANVAALTLTSSTGYDDWGQVSHRTSPDGVQSNQQHDPVALTLKAWRHNASIKGPSTVTYHNPSGSPYKEELHDTDETLVRTKEWARDGLDRVTRTTIKVPGEPDRVTMAKLDVYGRNLEQTLADNTVVSWTYAAHSDANHPETVTVTAPQTDQEGATHS